MWGLGCGPLWGTIIMPIVPLIIHITWLLIFVYISLYVCKCKYFIHTDTHTHAHFLHPLQNSSNNCALDIVSWTYYDHAFILTIPLKTQLGLSITYILPNPRLTRGSHEGRVTDIHESSVSWQSESLFLAHGTVKWRLDWRQLRSTVIVWPKPTPNKASIIPRAFLISEYSWQMREEKREEKYAKFFFREASAGNDVPYTFHTPFGIIPTHCSTQLLATMKNGSSYMVRRTGEWGLGNIWRCVCCITNHGHLTHMVTFFLGFQYLPLTNPHSAW